LAHLSGYAPGWRLTFRSVKTFLDLYFRFTKASSYFVDLRQSLLTKQNLPHLFLHSEMDIDAPPEEIQEYIKSYSNTGALVRSHKFKYSPNVRHMIVHRDEYWGEVNKYLKEVLQADKEEKQKK